MSPPLTLADKASHAVISQALQCITPDITVVSEEDEISQDIAIGLETFWLIDPLDGTKEFIKRTDEFTVNIALIHKGSPVFGVVSIPAQNLIYWGCKDLGAYRADYSKSDSSPDQLLCRCSEGPTRVIASKSHMNVETKEYIAKLPGQIELVQAGSSIKFLKIAENAADLYPRLGPTCEWDTAAAQAVLEGAGGQVMQLCGLPMEYGKTDTRNPYFFAKGI